MVRILKRFLIVKKMASLTDINRPVYICTRLKIYSEKTKINRFYTISKNPILSPGKIACSANICAEDVAFVIFVVKCTICFKLQQIHYLPP